MGECDTRSIRQLCVRVILRSPFDHQYPVVMNTKGWYAFPAKVSQVPRIHEWRPSSNRYICLSLQRSRVLNIRVLCAATAACRASDARGGQGQIATAAARAASAAEQAEMAAEVQRYYAGEALLGGTGGDRFLIQSI